MSVVNRLIEYLRAFQNRKDMYVQPVNVPTVQSFLTGFETGCHAFGFEIDRTLWRTALAARGWKRSSTDLVPQMEAKGLSETEIMDEFVEIEIEMLQANARWGLDPDP